MEDKIRGITNFFTRSHNVSLTQRKQDWTTRLVLRYTFLQIPALALIIIGLIMIQQWIELPAWFTWGFIITWIIKDAALFPLTWRAYDWDHAGEANSMIGRQGIVQEQLSPVGSIRVHGELWRARHMGEGPPIDKGKAVRVRETRGLTLFVEQVTEKHPTND